MMIKSINEEWRELPISKLAHFSRGISWRKSEESSDGVLVVSIPNIKDGKIDYKSKYNHYITKKIPENKKLQIGDIIFVGSSGSIQNVGRNAIVKELPVGTAAFASFAFNARPNIETIDPYFFYYICNSSQVSFVRYTKRAADGKYNFQLRNFEKDVKLKIPSLSEQKAIADILTTIQESIVSQQELITKLKELKQSMMRRLFTYGTKGEKTKMTEIGEVPESWEIFDFVSCLQKIKAGKSKQIPLREYQNEGKFPIIDQGKNFIAGYTDDKEKIISDNLPLIVFGDHTRILKFIDFPFSLGADGTQLIKPNNDLFDDCFFYYQLLNLDIPSKGYNRHFSILKEKKIMRPDMPEQKEIANAMASIDQKITIVGEKLKFYQNLFKTLLHELMSGNRRIII